MKLIRCLFAAAACYGAAAPSLFSSKLDEEGTVELAAATNRPPPPAYHKAALVPPAQFDSGAFRPDQNRQVPTMRIVLGDLEDGTDYGSVGLFLLDQKAPKSANDFKDQATGAEKLRDPYGTLSKHEGGFKNLSLFDVLPQFVCCDALTAKYLNDAVTKAGKRPARGLWSEEDADWAAPVDGAGAGDADRPAVLSVLHSTGLYYLWSDEALVSGVGHRDVALVPPADLAFLLGVQAAFCQYDFLTQSALIKRGGGGDGVHARRKRDGGGLGFTDLTMM